jgi:hypothetical protein
MKIESAKRHGLVTWKGVAKMLSLAQIPAVFLAE